MVFALDLALTDWLTMITEFIGMTAAMSIFHVAAGYYRSRCVGYDGRDHYPGEVLDLGNNSNVFVCY